MTLVNVDPAGTKCCATCCASIDGACINSAEPYDPRTCCSWHETEAEFAAGVEALTRFRIAIRLAPRASWTGGAAA